MSLPNSSRWRARIRFLLCLGAAEKMYDSDMAVHLGETWDAKDDVIRRNIALMKQWAKEGT